MSLLGIPDDSRTGTSYGQTSKLQSGGHDPAARRARRRCSFFSTPAKNGMFFKFPAVVIGFSWRTGVWESEPHVSHSRESPVR
jgi:hypothetical protein